MAIFGGMMKKPMFGQIPGLDMMQEAVKPPMQMNNVPMGAPVMPQKKPGFFSKGGGWIDALGAFGDAFSENGPVYAQQKAQRNRLMQEQQMAEQKRQQDRENFLFEESYKRANPMPRNDELANLMRNAGIDPEGPEAKAMYSAALTNKIYPERMVPFTDEQGNSGLMTVRSGMPQQQQIQEGATATNPETNEKIIFRNGQWQPVGGGGGNVTSGF
jgi:hypothetical protein